MEERERAQLRLRKTAALSKIGKVFSECVKVHKEGHYNSSIDLEPFQRQEDLTMLNQILHELGYNQQQESVLTFTSAGMIHFVGYEASLNSCSAR